MRKHYFGRQFKRDANERKALFRGLLNALVINERIRTTEAKAKAIKADADKLVTKAKNKKDSSYVALTRIVNHEAAQKLINNLGPRFSARNGGYTRITRVGNRIVDNAAMVVLEWTEGSSELRVENGELNKKESEGKDQKKKVESSTKIAKSAKKEVVKKKGKGKEKVKKEK